MKRVKRMFSPYFRTETPSAKADIDAMPYAYSQQETVMGEIWLRIYARYMPF